ncbi:MAG: carbon-nitrogen hydrolase family protein [Chloroflexi bacterium]|nr:carbon-nitrogen hydrolase family protein [Chloroflexota bacterium]
MPRKWSALAPAIAIGLWLWPFLYRIFGIPDAPFFLKHLGLLIGVFTFFTSSERKFNELTGFRWFILQGLSAWVGLEMIRGFIPVLGTMGFAANPLAGQSWLIQPVSIFSIYGLNLLIVLFNFALAQLIMHWIDGKWSFEGIVPVDGQATRRWALGTTLAVVIWVSISLVIYNQVPEGTQTIRVAALHMDLDMPGHQVDDAVLAERMQLLTHQTREAAEQGAEVIYVPEMAFGFDPQEQYTDELQALTAETDTYVYFTYALEDETGWHNETVMISPSGEFSPVYGKLHAFGEPPTVTAGIFPVNETPYGKLGSIICMDGVFTDAARNLSRNGAQIMAIPTYNTTVGISEQNWTHFVFRAVENQVPVVNADKGFYSMITDTHGKILADVSTPEGANEIVIADVTLSSGNSIYTLLGDWLGWISLAGFVFFMIFQNVVEKRAKKAERN